jgi:hypothetical protein
MGGKLGEIERRRQLYLGGRERADVIGRTAIVIDDGIATGATTGANPNGGSLIELAQAFPPRGYRAA